MEMDGYSVFDLQQVETAGEFYKNLSFYKCQLRRCVKVAEAFRMKCDYSDEDDLRIMRHLESGIDGASRLLSGLVLSNLDRIRFQSSGSDKVPEPENQQEVETPDLDDEGAVDAGESFIIPDLIPVPGASF